jgi:hypothetical protein
MNILISTREAKKNVSSYLVKMFIKRLMQGFGGGT